MTPRVAPAAATVAVHAWRHPRAEGAGGRCIGRTELGVDPRRARRLAHRIRAAVRRHGLPPVVTVSPAGRCRAVGRWLRRFGFAVVVDGRLAELDFGRWDGRAWADIPWAEVEAWGADLWGVAPGGGETLAQLAARVDAVCADVQAQHAPRLLVTHGGWLNALRLLPRGGAAAACRAALAAGWPAPPRPGAGLVVALTEGGPATAQGGAQNTAQTPAQTPVRQPRATPP